MADKAYIIIDMKSFYASCECVARGLPAMTTDLVVADPERGRGTICLAVSPSLKAKGVRNRCRVHEIPACFKYIVAPPRMQMYIDYAAEIYGIFLDYFCKDDIFVYSIDESFIDVTPYLVLYKKPPREIAIFMLKEIDKRLGLPASCGIGTNLYLAKIALDITAKHTPNRIGELTEQTFKETLWHHRPLTDFWRIGPGTQRTLHNMGIFDMAGVAACPFPKLRKKFGIDACILYDHAYGREPTTIAEIKAYKPKTKSVSNGQVLLRDYSFKEALTILREMADELALELVAREVITESVTMYIGYSMRPGVVIPASGGTIRFPEPTSSSSAITKALVALYHEVVYRDHAIRRVMLSANHVLPSAERQLSLFAPVIDDEREHRRQETILKIKKRFGKNSILKGMDLLAEGTTIQRNQQIGGHKSNGNYNYIQASKDIPTIRCPAGAERGSGTKGVGARTLGGDGRRL